MIERTKVTSVVSKATPRAFFSMKAESSARDNILKRIITRAPKSGAKVTAESIYSPPAPVMAQMVSATTPISMTNA